MNKKPYNQDWYVNVPGSTRPKFEMPNERTYYNTASNYHQYHSSAQRASNTKYRPNNYTYENIANTAGPAYSNVQYPLYDNINPMVKANLHSRSRSSLYSSVGYPSSGYSSISENPEAVSFDNDVEYFVSSSSRSRVSSASEIYESIRQPINTYRRELPSMYSRSLPRSISTSKHDMEVDSLSDILINSMNLKTRKKKMDFNANVLDYKCGLCGKASMAKDLAYITNGNVCHTKCLTCTHCGVLLKGKPFYYINNKPYCDKDYLEALDKCAVCKIPILDRILKATGRSYHADCFRCIICSKLLEGIHFTVDTDNQIYCIDDFHKKFAPRCGMCKLPITPEPGQEETIRFVALDRSFHIKCFRCEDCDTSLGKESDGIGCYPLDDHLLCKSCNAKRIQILSTMVTKD